MSPFQFLGPMEMVGPIRNIEEEDYNYGPNRNIDIEEEDYKNSPFVS